MSFEVEGVPEEAPSSPVATDGAVSPTVVDAATELRLRTQGEQFLERHHLVKELGRACHVFVRQIPPEFEDEETLRRVFSVHGAVRQTALQKSNTDGQKSWAIVAFEHVQGATVALEAHLQDGMTAHKFGESSLAGSRDCSPRRAACAALSSPNRPLCRFRYGRSSLKVGRHAADNVCMAVRG